MKYPTVEDEDSPKYSLGCFGYISSGVLCLASGDREILDVRVSIGSTSHDAPEAKKFAPRARDAEIVD